MDSPSSSGTVVLKEPTQSKARKKEEKVVITVRVEERSDHRSHKGSGNTPRDPWSWRKYGQKPIKGSPYPRGYYRCSSAKGCPAKKQVERSRTDASTLIITYTSSHNHAGPDHLHVNSCQGLINQSNEESQLHSPPPPLSPFSEDKHQVVTQLEDKYLSDQLNDNIPSTREKISLDFTHNIPTTKAKLLNEVVDDFFDELEELPLSLLCSSSTNSSFFDERIILLPF